MQSSPGKRSGLAGVGPWLTQATANHLLGAALAAVAALHLLSLLRTPLPFGWLLALLSIWLTCSAILYGRLVVAQIYAAAEIELRRNGLDRTTVLMQADRGGMDGYR